jgi:restriction endonuclease S subunit
MTDWPLKRIQDVCVAVNVGHVGTSSDVRDPHGISFLMGKNVGPGYLKLKALERVSESFHVSQRKSQLQEGDIVVVRIGNSGQAAKIPDGFGEANCSGLVIIKSPTKVLADFLVYYLNSPQGRKYSVSNAKGSTRQTLNTKSIAETPVPVPPLEEQKRIVALLDAATARVTELTACYEKACTHANNLFKSVICEMFEDVNAKSATRLGEICIDIVDCEHKTVPIDESGIAWAVGTRAMSEGQIDFSKAKPISSATYAEWTRRMVPRLGDLILAREAPVGPVVQVPDAPKVALGQRTVLIRPDSNVVFTPYLHYLLISEPIQRSMHSKSEGSVVSHLNVKDVRLLSLPMLPSLDEQKRIVARLDAMRAKTSEMVASYDAKLTAAKNLSQSILEAAFAGDL